MIKTSATHPIEVGFVDSSALGSRGRLGFTLAPGKRGPAEDGHVWDRDLDTDLARLRGEHGVDLVVSLLDAGEERALGIHNYWGAARRQGLELLKVPMRPGSMPTASALRDLAASLSARVSAGARVVVTCRGGRSRSGLVTAAVLVVGGVPPAGAVQSVRMARPGALYRRPHERLLHELSAPQDNLTPVSVEKWLRSHQLGPRQRVGSLDMYAVLTSSDGIDGLDCVLASDALETGLLTVAEMPEATVQQLQATAHAGPVLVLEGETLVGCKQNRVVTRTLIVPGGKTIPLQVGCMERGRWTHKSARFTSGAVRIDRSIRSRTAGERSRGGFDQGRLWAQVDQRLEDSAITSQTSDYHSYLSATSTSAAYRAMCEVPVHPRQIGVLIVRGSRFVALELVATPATWARVSSRTLPSLLLGDDSLAASTPNSDPEHWLRDVAKRCRLSPSVGLGEEIAVASSGLAGCGLWTGRSMAHLAVFGTEEQA